VSGQDNLQAVIDSLQVYCDDKQYGFAHVDTAEGISLTDVIGTFQEKEGLTIIAPTEYLVAKKLDFEGPFAKLTIEVHTSLELVGLTAFLAKHLTDAGISANVVAAYFHDHIFVQYNLRQRAIEALQGPS
jgi:hypothetical protein